MAHVMRSKESQRDNVYVINLGNDQGFVIVSGEDGADDVVLGYCDHGSFSYDSCPVQLKDLLGLYASQVDSLRRNPRQAAPRKAVGQWPSYIGSIVVGPLLTTTWSQNAPYNDLCPVVLSTMDGFDGRCPSGCVPTAIAQVMNYWKWPQKTIGKITVDVDSQGEYVYEDFSGHTYDWDNMLDHYGYDYNAEQAEAVAKLMADIGKAWGTEYGADGSTTRLMSVPMVENFGYEPGISRGSGQILF